MFGILFYIQNVSDFGDQIVVTLGDKSRHYVCRLSLVTCGT